ncbi:uncharacterized protein LOC110989016 [Acanthaster planci]|uniref:Uncharacterized protein LOC110989016 n=1 Tax=Acanthaster planci TaxID=133434 RepID=A0A8B7ZVG5_ACAPL|nr:uncharacterized protein LOC110989016 [Acanthaster planci]
MWGSAAAVLCLVLFCHVSALWKPSNDPAMSNLGLYYETMECDDENARCVHCFQEKAAGEVYMHTFEFTKDPAKYQINMFTGKVDRKLYVIRNNTEKVFRMCFEHNWTPTGHDDFKVDICMDNNFKGAPVAEGCGKPVAVVTFDYHHSDDKIHGQQIVYCTPTVTPQMTGQPA